MLNPRYYADLIGKPYKLGGRGPDAFDCWGLVRFVLERLGIENLPEYPSSAAALAAARMLENIDTIEQAKRDWVCVPLARIRPGIAILLRDERGMGSHIGLLLGEGKFLHISEMRGTVCVERIVDPLWSNRIVGFYKPNVGETPEGEA